MKISMHQIYYDPSQLTQLEPDFIPYDNTANQNREWAEYHVFETEFKKGTHNQFDYTGFVSWKFGQKTRIPGARFLEFVQKNPGADVYYINPFPMEELLFKNVWYQGEFYHPGIMEFAQQILARAGYEIDLRIWQQPRETFAFCNYWVGNQKFWDTYMSFTGKVAEILRSGLSDTEKDFLHSIASKTNNFSYIAFFMERMFSVFLSFDKEIRSERFFYSADDVRRRFPGLRAIIFQTLGAKSRLLLPLKLLTALAVKASRKGKEP
jgi:hypothetical protein